jgi:hypothetical protein
MDARERAFARASIPFAKSLYDDRWIAPQLGLARVVRVKLYNRDFVETYCGEQVPR